MITNDSLWKGIIEDLLLDFLTFFYPDQIFNLEKGYDFLDKELEELFPLIDSEHKIRRVDKLIKLFDTTGQERWILIHIEVQGYSDQNLPSRMFHYFYRILDRYKMPVTTLVILTDPDPRYNPSEFKYSVVDSNLLYQYRTYKVIEQSQSELEQSDNPFASVILTTLTALKMNKMDDIGGLELKTALVRKLLQKGFPKSTIRSLLNFVRFYTRSSTEKMNFLFENRVKELTSNYETMGVEEMIIQQAEEKGIEKGIEKGTLQNKVQIAKNMILKGLPDSFICEVLDVSLEFIDKVKAEM